MQGKELYLFCTVIVSLLIIFSTAPVHGQIGGIVSSTTGTVSSTTSTTTDAVNQITSPITSSTVSTNVTDTTGSVSTGNLLGLQLPNLAIPVSASSSVAGVTAYGNGTIVTSINGVQMNFWFDPQGPKGKHGAGNSKGPADPTITIITDDLSGNQITGMYVELQNSNGNAIASGFSPISFSARSGNRYVIHPSNFQNFVFNHWDDGTTNPSRAITPTQAMTLTAYYTTGGAATAPLPPTNLTANATSSSQIDLSWAAPQSNGGAAITGYKIERSTDGATWSTISSNTGTTSTAFSDTGLQSGTAYTYRVSAVNSAGQSAPSNTASATTKVSPSSIIKVQSGLVAFDSLTNVTKTQKELQATPGYWFYDGDAPAENATFSFFRDGGGFHVGIQAPQNGTWAGFYGVSPNHNAQFWHAQITNPIRTTKTKFYENGLYVQTTNGSINYVACTTFTNNQTTAWAVVNATGNIDQITSYEVLYFDTSANQPLTRDCSIATNGNDFLAVYFDGSKVYENDNANLRMPAPFNAFLEPQSSDAGEFLVGTFKNYYVTTEQNIHLTNLPSNAATVTISNSTGVLAASPVSGGAATINVGRFAFPLAGTIKVYDLAGNLIASSPESIYGGDVYSIKAPGGVTVPSAPTNLVATSGNGQVTLSWSAPASNGGSPITGYKIYRGTTSGGESSTPLATVTTTSYTDSGLTAGQTYYYTVKAINSAGESPASNEASATPTGITLNNVQSISGVATLSSSNQVTLSNFNAGTGSNKLLVVGISANANDAASVTFGGAPLARIAHSFVNNDAEFWYIAAPAGTGDIVVTMNGPTHAVVGAYSLSGVDQALPIPIHAVSRDSSFSSPTISLTTTSSNSWVLDLPSIYGDSTLGLPTCTQQWNANMPGFITGASSSVMVPTPGMVTCSWTASPGEQWDDAAVEIKPAG